MYDFERWKLILVEINEIRMNKTNIPRSLHHR